MQETTGDYAGKQAAKPAQATQAAAPAATPAGKPKSKKGVPLALGDPADKARMHSWRPRPFLTARILERSRHSTFFPSILQLDERFRGLVINCTACGKIYDCRKATNEARPVRPTSLQA